MAQAIQFAQNDGGGYDSEKMFGKPSDPAWQEHDPYLLADKLQGTSLYISSGSGVIGPHDQQSDDIPLLAPATPVSASNCSPASPASGSPSKLAGEGVAARVVYRPSGTRTWPYWQFEMQQAWPQATSALGLAVTRSTAPSGLQEGRRQTQKVLGNCLAPDTRCPVAGPVSSAAGSSPAQGSQDRGRRVGGAYSGASGPGSPLGLPTSDELSTRDRKGRYNTFQRGRITWDAKNGTKIFRWGSFQMGSFRWGSSAQRSSDSDASALSRFIRAAGEALPEINERQSLNLR